MGLFDSLKRRRELDALGRALAAEPTVERALALADRQAAYGQLDAAVGTTRDGLRRFPRSERLFSRYASLRRQQVGERMRALKAQLSGATDPAAHGELIDIYLDLDEIDRALELCKACIEQFPDHALGYLQAGRIRLWRWRQDRLARDGRKALELLNAAADRNRNSTDSMRLLAELYLQLGARGAALRQLRALEQHLTDDPTLGELLVRAEALPPSEETFDDQLERAERGGQLALNDPRVLTGLGARVQPPSHALEAEPPDPARLSSGLDDLSGSPGFLSALLLAPGGAVVDARPPQPPAQYPPLAAALLDVARSATMRCDLGRFYRGQVEGPDGPVLLAECNGYGLAIFLGPAAAADPVWGSAETLIANAFGSGR